MTGVKTLTIVCWLFGNSMVNLLALFMCAIVFIVRGDAMPLKQQMSMCNTLHVITNLLSCKRQSACNRGIN